MSRTTGDAVVLRIPRAPKAPPVAALNPDAHGLPCELNGGEMWFAESPSELERAKALCLACPVRTACLAGAVERREPAGVWGGEIFDNGKILPRKRPRGRPRKDAAA
jgi:WhiB family redox-sensing transcriptional regulator